MRFSFIVALLLATSATSPLAAQQVSGVLTLEEALRIARANAPAYQRVENDLDVAAADVRSAWGAFLPSLSTSLGFNGSNSTAVTGQDDFGRPVELPEARSFRSSSASQSISSQLLLFDGGASIRNLRAQRALYGGAEAQVAATHVQLDAQVARAFYAAVRAQRDIALEAQLLASAREQLERTESLLRLAARNRVDVLGARENVLTYEQSLARVQAEAEKSRLTLATAIGLDVMRLPALDTVLPVVFDPATLDAAALVARATAASPTVLARRALAAAARHRAAAASARRWPTLSASASYGRSMSLSSYSAFGELNPQNTGLSFGLSASLPLFSRFQTLGSIATAAAAAEDAVHDVRAAELAVAADVRAALIDLTNAYRSLQLAEERAAISVERLELAQEQYRLGGISFTALQNVIDRTAQAERQALDARFGFQTARVALEEKLGGPLER